MDLIYIKTIFLLTERHIYRMHCAGEILPQIQLLQPDVKRQDCSQCLYSFSLNVVFSGVKSREESLSWCRYLPKSLRFWHTIKITLGGIVKELRKTTRLV